MGLSGSWHRPPANYNNDNNVSSFFIFIFIQLNWLCGLEKTETCSMNSKWTGLKILFSVGFTNHLLNAAVKRNLIVRGLV